MKKEFLKIASKLENFHQERKKNQNDKYVSDELAKERIAEAEKKFKQSAEDNFQKVEKRLDKQAQKTREKLEDIQSGDYDKRQYEYNKAVNEMSHYESPIDYLKDKAETASSEIELQEARKAALSKARATDAGDYEQIKQEVVNTMNEEELKARKQLAEVDLQKYNLKAAKNRVENDFYDDVNKEYGDPELIKTDLVAFSKVDNLEKKASKKIPETL